METNEIIKGLKKMATNTGTLNCLGCEHENGCGVHGCQLIKAAIEKLEAEQWIPIEDRVPETDDYVLLSFDNFEVPSVGTYEADQDGGGAFYLSDDGVSLSSYGIFVNAWRPLPKRHKSE